MDQDVVNFCDRIAHILDSRDLKRNTLATLCDCQFKSLNRYLNHESTPGVNFAISLLKVFPEISSDWLMLGRGDMLRNMPQESPTEEQQPEATTQEQTPANAVNGQYESREDLIRYLISENERLTAMNVQLMNRVLLG